MEFRNIIISNPARLSIRHGQLCISQEQDVTIPIEDICTLMLESQQISVSAAALESLASSGVTVFLCDKTHLPALASSIQEEKLLLELPELIPLEEGRYE